MSLSRGEGFAIGAVPVSVLLELQQQAQRCVFFALSRVSVDVYYRTGAPLPLVKIRDRAGIICRAAYLELLDS